MSGRLRRKASLTALVQLEGKNGRGTSQPYIAVGGFYTPPCLTGGGLRDSKARSWARTDMVEEPNPGRDVDDLGIDPRDVVEGERADDARLVGVSRDGSGPDGEESGGHDGGWRREEGR
jgi:hypothetical protein